MNDQIINWEYNDEGDTNPIDIMLEADGVGVVDFDEIQSNLFGKRSRKRRQARKLARIRSRQERRRLKRAGRREAQRERQDRRTERKTRRVERKSIGDDEEQGGEEAGYSEPQEEQDATDEGEEADTQAEEDAVDEETGPSDEESGFTGDLGADGVRSPTADDIEFDDYFSSAEGFAKINPKVKSLSARIEKNKEYIKRLKAAITNVQGALDQRSAISKWDSPKYTARMSKMQSRLAEREAKLAQLEQELAGYSRMDGDFSDANGSRRAAARKRAEVRHGKRAARRERRKFIRESRQGKRQERRAARKARHQGTTEVDATLNPDITDERIEIPPTEGGTESSFNGTGLIGLDNQADADAPTTRNVELQFSNANGVMGNMNPYLSLAIGVGIGVAAIYLYKKYGKK